LTTWIEHYDIHGLVSLTVRRSAALDPVPAISQPFRYFQVASLDREPDVVLEVGDFEPDNRDCYLVDHQFFVRENYFYCEDAYGAARWRVEIQGFEYGQTRVRFCGTYRGLKGFVAPGMLPASLLLKQVAGLHLSRQGYFLAHGAAASKEGQAIVLFGRGGTYKTTLLMTLLRQDEGWQMMGDDAVILGGGQVLSFPALLGFFAFRYQHLPTEKLSLLDRVRLLFFLANFKPTDVPVVDRSRLIGLVHCTVGPGDEVSVAEAGIGENVVSLARGSAVEEHTSYNIGHTSVFPRYVEAYTYVFPGNSLARRWGDACARLLVGAQGVQSLVLGLPRRPKGHHFSEATRALGRMALSPGGTERVEAQGASVFQTAEAVR